MLPRIETMTFEGFRRWLNEEIITEVIFTSRDKLLTMLASNRPPAEIENEFREFFNGYFNLAFTLEEQEDYILSVVRTEREFSHLRARVVQVEAERKTSLEGRIARRTGAPFITEPQPEIKVTELSDSDFRKFVESLVNSELFASHERLVKLMKLERLDQVEKQLKSEFWEFFVCYLELEQSLENYDYDPDEGLELRPEFIEELKREEEYIKSGGKMYTLEEVAKEFGIDLKCMN